MKKFIVAFFAFFILINPSFACFYNDALKEQNAVKKLLNLQVKYANKNNFNKFINTYDSKYKNSDGFNLDVYSQLVKEIWSTYSNIKYEIFIKNIAINDNKATVELIETSFAKIPLSEAYDGELKSEAKTIYYLEKIEGDWKVVSDSVLEEETTMLYGDAKGLDIKLSAPLEVSANTDYIATLEFVPPNKTIAIASIASDIVEYPQKPTKEVFRPMPEDNILERFFTSNNKNQNEFIVASIGLTQTEVSDLSIKLNLTGFGYAIRRVNVVEAESKGDTNE